MIWPPRPVMSTLAAGFLVALVGAGCFLPDTNADPGTPGTQPPGELFGADAGTGSGSGSGSGCTDPSPLSSLHVKVRTTAVGGRFAPRNVGAIWIETSAGKFVKTLERWGQTRARYIVRWNGVSAANVVDAVTSATLSSHVTHDRTWNLKDLTKCEVPSGSYRVVIEHTDRNSAGVTQEIPFTLGQTPVTQTPADATNFHDMLLEIK